MIHASTMIQKPSPDPTPQSPPSPPANQDQNDIAQALTGRPHLSWSQLSSFRSCPRRWFFSHVEQAEPQFIASSLLFGSAIHAAVEHHYQSQMQGQTTQLQDLLDIYQANWQSQASDSSLPIHYGKQEDENSLQQLAQSMLTAFLASPMANLDGQVIAVEENLLGMINPQLPDLRARVDVAWLDSTQLHVMDVKTARSKWGDEKLNEQADQLRLYALLAQDFLPNSMIQLHFGIITKNKSPQIQLLTVPPPEIPPEVSEQAKTREVSTEHAREHNQPTDQAQTHDSDSDSSSRNGHHHQASDSRGQFSSHNSPSSSSSVVDLMLPVWKAMKHGTDFANPNPMNCSTCPYQSRCPAFKGRKTTISPSS